MGKRELLLIVAFVIVGAVVYQATAPPADPNARGFSFARFMDAARREIRGRRASADETKTAKYAVSNDVTEVRIVGPISEIEIAGEARSEVETSFHVRSNGFDDAEARRLVNESKVILDRAAAALILRAEFPREGRQQGTLKVIVPARLRVRVEGASRLTITNVAQVEIAGARGETTVRKVAGKVEVAQRGGPLVVEDVGSLEFTGRSGEINVTGVRGDTRIRLEQGGEVTLAGLAGEIDCESRNADVTFENLEETRGPIRINATGGAIRLKKLKSEARIDSRGSDLDVTMSGAAAVSLYSEGESVTLTPPTSGYKLDAVVVNGQIGPRELLDKMGLKYTPAGDSKETRASGSVNGDGPTITIRTTHADVTLRSPDEKTEPDKKTDASGR